MAAQLYIEKNILNCIGRIRTIQLEEFKKVNKQFEPENMTKIKFVFDKSDKGSIYLTNIGIRKEFSD